MTPPAEEEAPQPRPQPGHPVTLVTSTECPPQSHAWVRGNLVCHPSEREHYAAQLAKQGHPAAEPTRQQVRAVERWCNKRLARLAVAGMAKLP